jgi:hypothetical protein
MLWTLSAPIWYFIFLDHSNSKSAMVDFWHITFHWTIQKIIPIWDKFKHYKIFQSLAIYNNKISQEPLNLSFNFYSRWNFVGPNFRKSRTIALRAIDPHLVRSHLNWKKPWFTQITRWITSYNIFRTVSIVLLSWIAIQHLTNSFNFLQIPNPIDRPVFFCHRQDPMTFISMQMWQLLLCLGNIIITEFPNLLWSYDPTRAKLDEMCWNNMSSPDNFRKDGEASNLLAWHRRINILSDSSNSQPGSWDYWFPLQFFLRYGRKMMSKA